MAFYPLITHALSNTCRVNQKKNENKTKLIQRVTALGALSSSYDPTLLSSQ